MRFILTLLVSALACGHAAAELGKTGFDDWAVSCNAKNYCIAETAGEASNGEAFRLKIERGAKAESQVYVTFDPATKLQTGLPARIEIESIEEENYGYFGTVSKVYKGNEMTFGGDADRDLMEKLRMGEVAAIQIEFGGATGTLTYRVSLSGITHALLRIDEEQGRIGRLDAIVAWGGLPAEQETRIAAAPQTASPAKPQPAAPAVPPAPQQSDLPPPIMPSQDLNNSGIDRGALGQVYAVSEIPDSIQMMGYRTLDCQLEETVPAFGAKYFAEGDVETWIVPCQMADANVPYYMAIHIPFDPSLDEWKEFETPPGFNQPNHALVNNLFYDPDTGNVTGTTYYSPNYDCGAFERHEVEAESGNYTLVEYLEKSGCDGVTGPPEGWPLNWTIDEMGG
ncbi:DUF1176 domain-containing protein [Roseibium sp. AS2]|uniref:DUF1176 domain-containing protein n=1 Tax=Roseibium sp. AS2 TaxID=3135781 RepID=UPI003178E420